MSKNFLLAYGAVALGLLAWMMISRSTLAAGLLMVVVAVAAVHFLLKPGGRGKDDRDRSGLNEHVIRNSGLNRHGGHIG